MPSFRCIASLTNRHLERALRDRLSPEDQQRISWLHYGQHTSTATLVRGEDLPHHFVHELRPEADMSRAVLAYHALTRAHAAFLMRCTGRTMRAGAYLIAANAWTCRR